jgi:opacity protein-like surface antigen
MKKLLMAGGLSLVLPAGVANAADLPIKAPAYTAPAASSWSGFYLGGGLGFRASQTGETFAAESFGGGPLFPAAVATPNAATSEPLNGIALRGNVFAGYNFQVAPRWVLGIEGDVGASPIKPPTSPGGLSPTRAALRRSRLPTALPNEPNRTPARAPASVSWSRRQHSFTQPVARPGSTSTSARVARARFAQASSRRRRSPTARPPGSAGRSAAALKLRSEVTGSRAPIIASPISVRQPSRSHAPAYLRPSTPC